MKERIKGDLAQPEPDDRLRDIIRKKKEETYRNNIFVFRLAPSSNFDQRQQTRRKTPPLRGLISTNEMDTPRSRKTARNCEDKSSFLFFFSFCSYTAATRGSARGLSKCRGSYKIAFPSFCFFRLERTAGTFLAHLTSPNPNSDFIWNAVRVI